MLPVMFLCLSVLVEQTRSTQTAQEHDAQLFTNVWAVQLDSDESSFASEVAASHGFTNKGRIAELPGFFKYVHKRAKSRHRRSADAITSRLQDHPSVKWVEQQRILSRAKRNLMPLKRGYISRETRKELGRRFFNDADWPKQWYLLNYGQSETPLGNDINVMPVWQRGIRGQGIVVSVLDDGLDHTHLEFKGNFDPEASFDFNDNDPDPFPNDTTEYNAHGTKCGGEIGARANNNLCGVGVAPLVKLGGIRMLDGPATDQLEANAMGFNRQYIDVYSASWGPTDDGKTFGGPERLGKLALEKGAKEGRGGKGNIFVWATGNGGYSGDDCNADGYTSSIYTISVGSVSSYGLSTYYDEKCASTTAVIYTADSHRGFAAGKPLVTTDLHHKCTNSFRGTSSAAPLAAGIMAVVLQANPQLTWRDVQHLIAHTAKLTSQMDDGWKKNAVGIKFNHKFGFGLLDAGAMVHAALNWTNVADQHLCVIEGPMPKENDIPSQGQLELKLATDACKGTGNFVKKLEHVQVVLSLEHRRRGDITIDLTSPQGTQSNLLSRRSRDDSNKGLKNWPFMTMHLWGEDPAGEWTVVVRDTHGMVEETKVDMEEREARIIRQKMLAQWHKSPFPGQQNDFSEGDDWKTDQVYDETIHGRFKGDYMEELKNDATETRDEVQKHLSKDLEFAPGGLVAGRVLDWNLVLYGTAESRSELTDELMEEIEAEIIRENKVPLAQRHETPPIREQQNDSSEGGAEDWKGSEMYVETTRQVKGDYMEEME